MEWYWIVAIAVGSLAVLLALSNLFYKQFFKRFYDIVLSGLALLVLSPVLLILIIVGAVAMHGNPFFVQPRPGRIDKKTGKEKIFNLIKFRTMSNQKDKDGNLLPDSQRLNKYGLLLRKSSLDELPELLNIFVGDMSIVGPRPQLVRDMVFMTEEQRKRHTVTPGLTGLAQVSGRNNIPWEMKLDFDLRYLENITLGQDVTIVFRTVFKVFKREDTVRQGTCSDIDFGDWLLENGNVTKEEYQEKQKEAKELLTR